jgi:hypothetical protein
MTKFPSLSAWIRAIKLSIPGMIVANIEGLRYLILSTTNNRYLILFAFWLVFTALAYAVLRAIYNLMLKLLWKNPPIWLVPTTSRRQFSLNVLYMTASSTISIIIGAIIISIFYPNSYYYQTDYLITVFWIFWVISTPITAYFYSFQDKIHSKLTKNRDSK